MFKTNWIFISMLTQKIFLDVLAQIVLMLSSMMLILIRNIFVYNVNNNIALIAE